MAYTKPNTFVDGAALDAADLEGNLADLRTYVNKGVIAADLDAKAIEPKHMRRPDLAQLGSTVEMRAPSGAQFVVQQPALGISFDDNNIGATNDDHRWPMSHNGCCARPVHKDLNANQGRFRPIQKCARSFYLDHKANLLVRYQIRMVAPFDNIAPAGDISYLLLFLDDTVATVTHVPIIEHLVSTAFEFDGQGRYISGMKVFKDVAKGDHSLSLRTALVSQFAFIGRSFIHIEAHTDRS